MTRTDEPTPSHDAPTRTIKTRGRGLTRETVDEIYDYVLSGGETRRTPKGQFTKGSSGNPRGRPKHEGISAITPPDRLEPESLSAIALRHGARKVKAQTEDGEVEITLKEATLTKMVREAIRGNTGHSRTFIQLLGRAEAEEAKRVREVFRHWSVVKEQAVQLHDQAEAAGDEPPLFVHPDDIKLQADGTVAIVGPTEPGDIAVMRYIHSKVEYHLANVAYCLWMERRWVRLRGARRTDGILYAKLDFWCEQKELPPRLQMSVEAVTERLRTYARISGRDLHALLRKEAALVELPVPPRDARVPIVVPQAALDLAEEKGVSTSQLLTSWININAAVWNTRAERDACGSVSEGVSSSGGH
ncbi:MAG: DUF5681 domain-containing protein [Janthinobacterium lividum]